MRTLSVALLLAALFAVALADRVVPFGAKVRSNHRKSPRKWYFCVGKSAPFLSWTFCL